MIFFWLITSPAELHFPYLSIPLLSETGSSACLRGMQ